MAPANSALAAQRKAARAQLGDVFDRFDMDLDGCLRAIDLSQLSLYIDVDDTLSTDCPASIRPMCCQRLLPSGTKCGSAALNPLLNGLCLDCGVSTLNKQQLNLGNISDRFESLTELAEVDESLKFLGKSEFSDVGDFEAAYTYHHVRDLELSELVKGLEGKHGLERWGYNLLTKVVRPKPNVMVSAAVGGVVFTLARVIAKVEKKLDGQSTLRAALSRDITALTRQKDNGEITVPVWLHRVKKRIVEPIWVELNDANPLKTVHIEDRIEALTALSGFQTALVGLDLTDDTVRDEAVMDFLCMLPHQFRLPVLLSMGLATFRSVIDSDGFIRGTCSSRLFAVTLFTDNVVVLLDDDVTKDWASMTAVLNTEAGKDNVADSPLRPRAQQARLTEAELNALRARGAEADNANADANRKETKADDDRDELDQDEGEEKQQHAPTTPSKALLDFRARRIEAEKQAKEAEKIASEDEAAEGAAMAREKELYDRAQRRIAAAKARSAAAKARSRGRRQPAPQQRRRSHSGASAAGGSGGRDDDDDDDADDSDGDGGNTHGLNPAIPPPGRLHAKHAARPLPRPPRQPASGGGSYSGFSGGGDDHSDAASVRTCGEPGCQHARCAADRADNPLAVALGQVLRLPTANAARVIAMIPALGSAGGQQRAAAAAVNPDYYSVGPGDSTPVERPSDRDRTKKCISNVGQMNVDICRDPKLFNMPAQTRRELQTGVAEPKIEQQAAKLVLMGDAVISEPVVKTEEVRLPDCLSRMGYEDVMGALIGYCQDKQNEYAHQAAHDENEGMRRKAAKYATSYGLRVNAYSAWRTWVIRQLQSAIELSSAAERLARHKQIFNYVQITHYVLVKDNVLVIPNDFGAAGCHSEMRDFADQNKVPKRATKAHHKDPYEVRERNAVAAFQQALPTRRGNGGGGGGGVNAGTQLQQQQQQQKPPQKPPQQQKKQLTAKQQKDKAYNKAITTWLQTNHLGDCWRCGQAKGKCPGAGKGGTCKFAKESKDPIVLAFKAKKQAVGAEAVQGI